MIPVLGTGGPGFNSRLAPNFSPLSWSLSFFFLPLFADDNKNSRDFWACVKEFIHRFSQENKNVENLIVRISQSPNGTLSWKQLPWCAILTTDLDTTCLSSKHFHCHYMLVDLIFIQNTFKYFAFHHLYWLNSEISNRYQNKTVKLMISAVLTMRSYISMISVNIKWFAKVNAAIQAINQLNLITWKKKPYAFIIADILVTISFETIEPDI